MGFKSSVQQAMTRGFRNISVEKIRINPENFYAQTDFEQEAIDQMADLLNENGQDANILVFADPLKMTARNTPCFLVKEDTKQF